MSSVIYSNSTYVSEFPKFFISGLISELTFHKLSLDTLYLNRNAIETCVRVYTLATETVIGDRSSFLTLSQQGLALLSLPERIRNTVFFYSNPFLNNHTIAFVSSFAQTQATVCLVVSFVKRFFPSLPFQDGLSGYYFSLLAIRGIAESIIYGKNYQSARSLEYKYDILLGSGENLGMAMFGIANLLEFSPRYIEGFRAASVFFGWGRYVLSVISDSTVSYKNFNTLI